MGKSSPHGTVRRCACAFHGSSVRKVRNIFRASRLRIPSKISAKDGAQSILKKATPGTWEYDAVPLISCFTESSCSSEICKSRVVGNPSLTGWKSCPSLGNKRTHITLRHRQREVSAAFLAVQKGGH